MTTTHRPAPAPATGPADLTELRARVRAVVERWSTQRGFTPRCDAWLRGHDPDFSRELAAHGWIGMTWPAELGGGDRSALERLVVTEELLRAGAPVAAHWIADRQIGPAILRYGSPELQRRFLPGIARGEVTFCLGMSETEAGSDLASVRTVAEATSEPAGGWRLRGRKIWTSQAHRSSHAYVLARTGTGARRHEGLSEFVVAMDSPGVAVRPIHDLSGEHHFNEVTFDDVPVPADRLLGTAGDGWRQVTEQLAFERGGMERVLSTYPLLAAVLAAAGSDPETAREFAGPLGGALARLAGLRRLAWRTAQAVDAGQAPVQQAAMLKDLGTVFEGEVNELARQVLRIEPDPAGTGDALLLAQGVLAAPGFTIRGGTTEVLRTIIARAAAAPGGRTGGGDGASSSGGDAAELRALADQVLADRATGQDEGTPERPAELPEVWRTVSDLQWPQVATPEPLDGAGGTLDDLVTLVEATGRRTTAIPLAETAWARRLLAAAGRPLVESTATVVLPGRGEELLWDGAGLSGTATRVPWGCAAERLLVLARDRTGPEVLLSVAADASGLVREPGVNLAGEPRDTVRFDAVHAERIGSGAPEPGSVAAAGALLRTAAMVGALERAVTHTVEHVTVREQFGRPLLAFQAVGATLARMASELALARTALSAAVAASRSRVAVDRVAAAVVVAGAAATEVARGAHQLHGAMGVTREHPLHRATRRLWSWRDEFGGDRHWARLLGERLLPLGPDGVWDWLTADLDRQD